MKKFYKTIGIVMLGTTICQGIAPVSPLFAEELPEEVTFNIDSNIIANEGNNTDMLDASLASTNKSTWIKWNFNDGWLIGNGGRKTEGSTGYKYYGWDKDHPTFPEQGTVTRTGYVLKGWNTNPDGTGMNIEDIHNRNDVNDLIDSKNHLEVYAIWNKASDEFKNGVYPLDITLKGAEFKPNGSIPASYTGSFSKTDICNGYVLSSENNSINLSKIIPDEYWAKNGFERPTGLKVATSPNPSNIDNLPLREYDKDITINDLCDDGTIISENTTLYIYTYSKAINVDIDYKENPNAVSENQTNEPARTDIEALFTRYIRYYQQTHLGTIGDIGFMPVEKLGYITDGYIIRNNTNGETVEADFKYVNYGNRRGIEVPIANYCEGFVGAVNSTIHSREDCNSFTFIPHYKKLPLTIIQTDDPEISETLDDDIYTKRVIQDKTVDAPETIQFDKYNGKDEFRGWKFAYYKNGELQKEIDQIYDKDSITYNDMLNILESGALDKAIPITSCAGVYEYLKDGDGTIVIAPVIEAKATPDPSTNSDKPDTETSPDKPATPVKPEEPTKPEEPVKPEESNTPVKPEEPTQAEEPDAPTKPVSTDTPSNKEDSCKEPVVVKEVIPEVKKVAKAFKKALSPKTGDYSGPYVNMLRSITFGSGLLLIFLLFKMRKKK